MFLDVSKALRSPGTRFPFQQMLAIPVQDVLGEEVSFDPVQLEGSVEAVGESILLNGNLKTTAHAPCANCLAPAQAALDVPFSETFVHEAQPEDPDVFPYEGSRVELDQMALSVVMLALPMRFLCREDCQGFCAQCGMDKNLCTCQKELPDKHPFAALQQLLTKDEEV